MLSPRKVYSSSRRSPSARYSRHKCQLRTRLPGSCLFRCNCSLARWPIGWPPVPHWKRSDSYTAPCRNQSLRIRAQRGAGPETRTLLARFHEICHRTRQAILAISILSAAFGPLDQQFSLGYAHRGMPRWAECRWKPRVVEKRRNGRRCVDTQENDCMP
jgi:hypothetical protein